MGHADDAGPAAMPAPSHARPGAPGEIVPLAGRWATSAVDVLARAYATNPIHRRVFGAAVGERNRAFFRHALLVLRGEMLVALRGDDVVGVVHWVASPGCQLSPLEQLRLVPSMLQWFGGAGAVGVARWLATWAAHDLREPHLHLGPIAVAPEAQGGGVGRQLMARYCAAQDAAGIAGYLETDRPENVAFYQRFDFDLLGEVPVLGVPTYRMTRPPRGGHPAAGRPPQR